jgi:DNA repair protein RecO (recombination protein O)
MSTVPSGALEPGGQSPVAERARRALAASHGAFVLHSYDWSESSLIVELFTRDAGRVVAAAKGAKRPTSQLRAVLMPFQPIAVQFARFRGDDAAEVRTLRSAEWGGGVAPAMRGAAWFAGFYLNELVLRLLARDDPHPRLFDAYAGTLPCLADEARGEAALRAFELLLLRESGVLPELDRTTLTQSPLTADGRYALQAGQGLGEAAAGAPALPGGVWLALAAALQAWSSWRDTDAIGLQPLHAACALGRQTLKAQLRAQLHYHLGGAMLRTRQVMIDTQRLLEGERPLR